VKTALAESQPRNGAATPRGKDGFCAAAAAVPTSKQKSAGRPSGHKETDESRDAEEKEENDCAINRAKPGLFRVVGRDERSIKNMALPAHVASNLGHAMQSSMGRATG
jgi:hypothetical protein